MTDTSEKAGLSGVWGWPNLWWKAKCGCKGYGSLLLYRCDDGTHPAGYELTVASPYDLDLDNECMGAMKLEPMDIKEIENIIIAFRKKSKLAKLAEEILTTLRGIGKLTSEG